MVRRSTAALALLLGGCAKASPADHASTDAGRAAASTSAAPMVLEAGAASGSATAEGAATTGAPDDTMPSARVPAADLPLAAREARRASLRRLADEPALAVHDALLRAHFKGDLPSPLELQTIALGGDRSAWLTYGEARRREPFLFVTDARGEVLWTKERPLAGTRQIVTEMVLAPGPHGEVALLWCDIPTQIVGLRKWAADSVVLADFEVLEVDVCDALAGLYWPGRGWLAVASQHGAARAELLDERGARAWGPKGVELPWSARPSAPASIAVDSDTSAIVLQVGDLPHGQGSMPDRVLAMRYDTLGAKLWERPIDLGPASGSARIAVTPVEPGKVRVAIGRGTVALTSAGTILR